MADPNRKTRQLQRKKAFALEDPAHHLYMRAKRRAKKRGVVFTITEADILIPKRCPVLGVKLRLFSTHRDNSPSVDRIIPSLGYIPGNVAVISYRANRIKNDATVEELFALARWLKSIL